jgi:hypothetical protein
MIGDGDCGEIGGMKTGRGNPGTRRKPGPAPLCPPQIPHDKTRAEAYLYKMAPVSRIQITPPLKYLKLCVSLLDLVSGTSFFLIYTNIYIR